MVKLSTCVRDNFGHIPFSGADKLLTF